MKLTQILGLLNIFLVVKQVYSDICYDDLGCFTTSSPFSGTLERPFSVLPQNPTTISTKFYLYTRSNPINYSLITHTELNAHFNPSLETKFIIHGFLHNGFKKWILDIKDSLLRVSDYNVISVDWSKGNWFPYTQATANTQIVGAEIARLIKTLCSGHKISEERFHIIGHSLGAHIAGYAGKRLTNLGRITGLDPAGPYFENTDKLVRLDKYDASFVDVIHSDGSSTIQLGLGLMEPLGHVDFYPNGGKNQPKCPATSYKILSGVFNLATIDIDGVEEGFCCSHMSAVYFFLDSIENKDCTYTAYPCKNKEDFETGRCISCNSTSGCNHMGFWATSSSDQGSLHLNTQDADKFPYCSQSYQLKLNSNTLKGQTQTCGHFSIVLKNELDASVQLLVDDSNTVMKPGTPSVKLLQSTKNIGNHITSAVLFFTKTSNIFTSLTYQNEWSFKDIEIYKGDSQTSVKLCPDSAFINSGSSLTFKKC